ncbi:hypothetical protein BSZ39_08710 [Bowdeniella nasicola]|uniref:Electron transfer flavoprotein subunit alpha n=1 Tax=Bowdeniella nasicola TaxID=208480 RepID=A0A1Q5Q146_9ACTO|nr:electron transfer flavoprotein subunit alpha/FixB family protein [Bowdeniella nasicola]OKL53593.1 hypothetical protein BSZ39_08710 [Bowdeniella nasicola]
MSTLIVCRSADAELNRELAAAACPLGDVLALDLTAGEIDPASLYAERVFVPTGADSFATAPASAAAIAAAVAAEPAIDLVVVDASFAGKELAGYAAALLDSAVVTDAANLRREGEAIIAERTVLAGTWETTCELSRGVGAIALAPGNLDEGVTLPAAGAQRVDLPVELPAAAAATEVISRTPQETGDRIPLQGADIVVVAGRGIEGDFTLINELADQLGAAVGATRVVTDEGWIEHTAQIGQTGVVIRPRIYLGFGVSGAIHHTVGMQNSEIIVAVNTDSEAPIFEIADFGIVGDLNDVIPQLLAALRS